MDPSIASSATHLYPELGRVGASYAHSLFAALAVMALLVALYQAWRMREAFRLLDQAARLGRIADEAPAGIAGQNQAGESSTTWR